MWFHPLPLCITYLRIIIKIYIHHTKPSQFSQTSLTSTEKRILHTKIKIILSQHWQKVDNLRTIHPSSLHHNYNNKNSPQSCSSSLSGCIQSIFCPLLLSVTILISNFSHSWVSAPKRLWPALCCQRNREKCIGNLGQTQYTLNVRMWRDLACSVLGVYNTGYYTGP